MTESVITVAARELGYTERPINRTKYGQAFGLEGAPWCAIWIWWVFQYAGQPLPVKAAACSVLLQSFRQRKQFHSTPAPGDVFFCGATGGDHTDLVESVKPDGRTFTTIEGWGQLQRHQSRSPDPKGRRWTRLRLRSSWHFRLSRASTSWKH